MDRPEIPRTVKPRRPYTFDLPLLAVGPGEVFCERSGELVDRAELPELLRVHPSALVLCGNPEQLLAQLHRAFSEEPLWQFRLTPVERTRLLNNEPRTTEELIVNFFGFRRPNGHKRNRYFYPVAPGQFCRRSARELDPAGHRAGAPYWQLLLTWGERLRAFCQAHDLKPTPTAGGVAAQLLRHPRFYPEPRRKVPRATNEKVRPHLPGNYYELRAEPHRVYAAALYIDQADAHHYAAMTTPVPQADRLQARGRFHSLSGEPWARPGSRVWEEVTGRHHGLLQLRVDVPRGVSLGRYVPPAAQRPGERDVFVFTNELPDLLDLGVSVRWLSAAWTSPEADQGLQDYARWSVETVHRSPEDRPWLKPTLLAAYGILAAKPRRLTFGYRTASSGEPQDWYVGPERIAVMARSTEREVQSPIASVIQRAMVEAETRRISLELARELEADYGREVLAVYADAVLVRDRRGDPEGLPLLPPPWRVKERLTNLVFHTPQAFESLEIQRLPGVPKRDRVRYTPGESKATTAGGSK